MALLSRTLLGQTRLIHNKTQPIVVVAAARTPFGRCRGQLASSNPWQLGQIAVDAAVKRAAIPLEQIHHIFMNETLGLQQEHDNNYIFTSFLKKVKYKSIKFEENSEMDPLLMALEFVNMQPQLVAVAAGFVSATNNQTIENAQGNLEFELLENYVIKSLAKYTKSQSEGVFDSELVSLKIRKQQGQRRIIEDITHDEVGTEKSESCLRTMQYCDGASALVLTSIGKAQELKLSPLVVIKGFEYLHNTMSILYRSLQCVEKLFAKVGIQPYQIKHWEIDYASPQLMHHLEQNFNINSDLMNPHGSSQIFGHSPVISSTHLLTHISHTLNPSEYGCVISSSYHKSSALIVQKLFNSSVAHRLPLVTLYTKNPCPLCDILVEELELHFSGEYELEKIFIDTKENVSFLRLYRYDIPVVFLNKQFLCMHKLNHKLLRRRLNLLKDDL